MTQQTPEVFIPSPPTEDPPAFWRRLRWYLILVACVSLGTGVLLGRFAEAASGKPTLPPPATFAPLCLPNTVADSATGETNASVWYVYVSGAVKTPQVVTVTAGSLVVDALEAAGGPAPNADLDAVNLAAPLQNYQHITIPARSVTPTSAASTTSHPTPTAGPTTLININTADAATLASLPRIGPAMAERIIAYRQEHGAFQTIADIQQVAGIGPAIFAAIEPYITVGP